MIDLADLAGRAPRIAVGPHGGPYADEAVQRGGGVVVDVADKPDGLVWLDHRDVPGLSAALAAAPEVRWVQLPFAGVERMTEAGLIDDVRAWTCAKGSYAEPVAEHALMLGLAGLRQMQTRIGARSWGASYGLSLMDAPVTIVGGGGIAEALMALLRPFRAEVTIVRRRAEPVAGAARTVAPEALIHHLPGAALVVLALALTPETVGIIGAEQLSAMGESAWLVNVARGRHVDTDALVAALDAESIGGAALDVTDPEPLPDGHPLWTSPRCIITPHTADTIEMVLPLLADRIAANVACLREGRPLVGLVDPVAGY